MAQAFDAKLQFQHPLSFPDFDKRELRKIFRAVGNEVKKEARKLVSKKGISRPGAYPGKQSGALQRAISVRVSRSGFSSAVYSKMKTEPYYPAFVVYGHRGPKTDSKKQHGKRRTGEKVAKERLNYIHDAAEVFSRERYEKFMEQALANAIKPGFLGEGL